MPRRLPFIWYCGWLAAGLVLAGRALPAAAQVGPAGLYCSQQRLPPAARAASAALIVEAEVLSAQSFWGPARQHIFTRQRLRVFKILKGELPPDTTALTLLTEGGQVGLRLETLTNTLRLTPGQQGVFFLVPAAGAAQWVGTAAAWLPYGSEQGFIRYSLAAGTAADPFAQYPAIDDGFYRRVAGSGPRREVQPNSALQPARRAARGTQAASISSLAPEQLTAGTGAVLTISGSGFGASRGTGQVAFANADDGGKSFTPARPEDYLSWTDDRIRVRVPSVSAENHPAGSGLVRVTAADQSVALSPQPLTVVFALANAESTDSHVLDRPGHSNQNGRGGLSFQLTAAFRASAAAEAWRRALGSWRCQTGVNWDEDPALAPSDAVANDQHNIVGFDGGSGPSLPAGVLGRTTTYYKGCFGPGGEVVFTVQEVDMQFSSPARFQFGPAPAVTPEIDFETVAVHELGHAQQLSHLNRPGAVMHYAVARGQNSRQLDPASDIAGGRLVLCSRSFVNRGCSAAPMLPAPLTSLQLGSQLPALSWTTRDECFLTEFVVERSLGPDTLAWQTLATLPAGRPAASYDYSDAQPAPGLRYYRLRLRRPDGALDSAAPLAFSGGLLAGAQFYPNPITGNELRLLYPASAAGSLILVFYDELGRLHQVREVPLRAELNALSVNVAGLPPGFYVLTWRDAQTGRHGSQRLVRQ